MRKFAASLLVVLLVLSSATALAGDSGVMPRIDCDHSYDTETLPPVTIRVRACYYKTIYQEVCAECGHVMHEDAEYFEEHENVIAQSKPRPDGNGFVYAPYCLACKEWV